jgi:drug/metabolite transporter (DMT)-like permease
MVQFATVAAIAGIVALIAPSVPFSYSSTGVMAVVYCAIFPTVFCFTLQNTFQRYVTPTRAGLIYTLDPVWSLLAGLFVLGEQLKPLEWLGCGLIFLAALLPLSIRYLYERRLVRQYVPEQG